MHGVKCAKTIILWIIFILFNEIYVFNALNSGVFDPVTCLKIEQLKFAHQL